MESRPMRTRVGVAPAAVVLEYIRTCEVVSVLRQVKYLSRSWPLPDGPSRLVARSRGKISSAAVRKLVAKGLKVLLPRRMAITSHRPAGREQSLRFRQRCRTAARCGRGRA